MTRRSLADRFIRWGLHLQVVFLLMVDWGTIEGMRHADEVAWIHIVGLVTVNVILLASAVLALHWMRRAQKREAASRRPLGTLTPPPST